MEGWLEKRGPTSLYSWQRRWCILRAGSQLLVYYEDSTLKAKKGDVPINTTARIFPFSKHGGSGDYSTLFKERPHGFVLEVRVTQRMPLRRFFFNAPDEPTLNRWLEAVSNATLKPKYTLRVNSGEPEIPAQQDEGGADSSKAQDVADKDKEDTAWSDGSSDEESDDTEMPLPPREKCTALERRRGAYSAEAYGPWNQMRAAFQPPKFEKSADHAHTLHDALHCCPFFSHMDETAIMDLVDAMPIQVLEQGECIARQGDEGSEGYVILSGDADVYEERPSHASTDAPPLGAGKGMFVRTMVKGRFFGEVSMIWTTPRTRSVYARTPITLAKLERDVYQNLVMRREMRERARREECLRRVAHLETLDDEQIAHIADSMDQLKVEKDDLIVQQGEVGNSCFVVLSGECVAKVTTGEGKFTDVQEVKRYGAGDMFGELAILTKATRRATITATTQTVLLELRRSKFERMLGSLSQLQQTAYLSDPRKSLADFYQPGDSRGPLGALQDPDGPRVGVKSEWFAIYRYTSRDAIAKMLNGVAVGKGLNVKGKSAKKNRLSGFVPFLQISNNGHKRLIEESPPDSRVRVFFTTPLLRERAKAQLEPLTRDAQGLNITEPRGIFHVDDYADVFGLDIPEPVLREAYIMRPDISFIVGWETGRDSEPAFMDMNLKALRCSTKPKVVLYHVDVDNPMNPHGLLVAYAEATVKPVVSDFDTFTVGSTNMEYVKLAADQAELAAWSLEQTSGILDHPGNKPWNSRWLQVLKETHDKGVHHEVPEFGFGDATSTGLIAAVVHATRDSGAVRHGAECFNYGCPQDLEDDYLVVWDGFTKTAGKPWNYVTEGELRAFLLKMIGLGFSVPLNPVWMVRDRGWYEVYEAQKQNPKTAANLDSWYPPESGIIATIERIRRGHPCGFTCGGSPDSQHDPLAIKDLDADDHYGLVHSLAYDHKWKEAHKKLMASKPLLVNTVIGAVAKARKGELATAPHVELRAMRRAGDLDPKPSGPATAPT